jgi:hypothetical protein
MSIERIQVNFRYSHDAGDDPWHAGNGHLLDGAGLGA